MRLTVQPVTSVPLVRRLLLPSVLLLISLFLFAPAPAAAAQPDDSELDVQQIEALDLFAAINEIRADYDLTPFDWDKKLASAARSHAAYMARTGHYSHYQSSGSSPRMRIEATGYIAARTGEAIGWGYNQSRMLSWWLSSPPHRRLLLSDHLEQIGIGYLGDPDARWGHTWTLNFGTHE